ncbi:MAG: hypothetical protein HY720_17755 [Planctomycetes bacterium]|nr:hypothetical protein [Planctomycetota bacterium]
MAARTAKVAVSLPVEIHARVEAIRHEFGMGRSEVVVQALTLWLKQREEQELEERYVRGYLRLPEKATDLEGLFQAGLSSFVREKW